MDNGANSYRRFLSGDDNGLAEIVGAYKDGLILFLNGYTGSISAAEELAEETFFRLMIKKPGYSGKSSFKSWLYAIGRHIACDFLRKRSRTADEPVEDMAAVLADEADLERSYIRSEDRITLHAALKRLPGEYRRVLWLIYFEDFSNAEAGVTLGKNSRQIRNLLYRAKQSLKTELEKEGFEYEDY